MVDYFYIYKLLFKIGLVYKYHFFRTKFAETPFSTFISLTPSTVLTDVEIKEEMQLYGLTHEKEKENLISSKFGFSIQPMVGCRLVLYDHFLIHLSAGYDFELGGRIGPAHRVDWSGLRLNFCIPCHLAIVTFFPFRILNI